MEENRTILEVMGNNLKAARTSKGYTQEKLAEAVGVSDKFISMAERGVSGLSVTSIVGICIVLGIEPNALFSGIVNNNKDDIDSLIKDNISLLSLDDKCFIKDVLKYIFEKNEKGNR